MGGLFPRQVDTHTLRTDSRVNDSHRGYGAMTAGTTPYQDSVHLLTRGTGVASWALAAGSRPAGERRCGR